MEWWIWVLAGVGLMALEVLAPADFFLLLLGAAAVTTGGVVAIGSLETPSTQWLTFAVLAIASLGLLRPALRKKLTTGPTVGDLDTLVGSVATATGTVAAGEIGKVELRGTQWAALNAGTSGLTPGERCVVCDVNGLTVSVRSEKEEKRA